MPIPKELMDILACSFCKSDLKFEGDKIFCLNKECGIVYKVEEDIPNMLIDEAERPCPKCGTRRDFKNDRIECPNKSCGAYLDYPYK